MAGLKTKESNKSVDEYLDAIENEAKREDSKVLAALIEKTTGEKPKIWGDSMVGFGKYQYHRKGSKEELEWFQVGFAARKTRLTLYLSCDLSKYDDLISNLGKCKHGKGCLHINKLKDVDIDVLTQLIEKAKNDPCY